MLYHQHDPDPEMRPAPIGAEQHKKVIEHMAAGLVGAYRYFRQQGLPGLGSKRKALHNLRYTNRQIIEQAKKLDDIG